MLGITITLGMGGSYHALARHSALGAQDTPRTVPDGGNTV